MTVLTLLRSELRRLTSTRLGVLAFAALMTVPLLYGGFYLWGNLDPYGRFSSVPAGLVVADRGATDDGRTVHRGRDVADRLVSDRAFAWRELTADEARTELADGRVDFVLTFPAGFSQALASGATTAPERARISLSTSDANGYLSSTIAKSVATEVRDAVAAQVGRAAATRFLGSLSTIRSRLSDASSGASDLADGAASAERGAQDLASGSTRLADGAASAARGARSAAAGASSLAAGSTEAAHGAERLRSGAGQVADGAGSLATGLDALATRSRALPDGARQVADGAAQVADGDRALGAALRRAAGSTATADALAQRLAADGLSPAQIQQAVAVLAPSRDALLQAAGTAESLADGAGRVAGGARTVASGASTVSSAAAKASAGAGRVADGARALRSGASTLAGGTDRLASGAASLRAGTEALADGTAQVASGAGTVAKGSTGLQAGTHRLVDGAGSLRDGLERGTVAIPATTARERAAQAEAIGDPVAVSTRNTASAGSYGAGLAPLFLSLAAWIGSYALFLILRPLSRRAITAVRRPVRIALAGWLTPALLGAVQMAVLLLIATGPLGIRIVHPVLTLGLLLLTAGAFAAILLLLNAALGSVGQFLGLVLMLVQLVTAGGTFPWQTLPAPLAALHHALPMSYAVDALRQTMYGGDLALAAVDAGVLGVWLVAAVALTAAITARMTRHRTLRDLQPSLLGG
ncbi:YhgE/Pip family protein [Amnibacterium endophyticum]|uniref:YhgE/Pip family protein n=1 Tax=Amnibacterium endophyticum TaxID=2109337 RepID=A0ABW4LAN0_9MICO